MLLRVLQRLVRFSPGTARAVWGVVPETVRRTLSPLVFPVAAGPRSRGRALAVPEPSPHLRYDVVVDLAPAPRGGALPDGIFALGARGHRVITVSSKERVEEVLARESILDAIYVPDAHAAEERREAAARLGCRVLPAEGVGSVAEADAAFPEVTLVIVTHSSRDACAACLSAILRNTPWPGLEILVVDNGSKDGTAALLERVSTRDPRVRILSSPTNLGFARASNWALREASGAVVVLLNDDTVVGPGWLSRLVRHLESDAGLALVCPVTNEIGGDARVDTSYETLEEMEAFARRRAFELAGRRHRTETVALFCAAAARSTLESVGLLDERYEVGMFEDDDLSLTLRRRGFTVAVAEDAFVHHIGQASFSKLTDAEYLAIWEANRRRFETKWGIAWKPPKGAA